MRSHEIKGLLKSIELKNYIREMIGKERLQSGDPILSENKLVEKCGVSRVTVRKAIGELVNENILYRIQRKGTFVSEKVIKSAWSTYALFILAKGHIYENQSRILFQEIQKQGCSSQVVDLSGFKKIRNEIIHNVINNDPLAVIIDGFFGFPFATLIEEHESGRIKNLCFINRCENNYRFRAIYVLSDNFHGTYLATSHLLNLGHKKVLFVMPAHKLQEYPNPVYKHIDHFHLIEGYRKALLDYGFSKEERIFFKGVDPEGDNSRFVDILTSSDKPTAVFAYGDFLAKQVIDVAKKQGLRIPEDLAVIGYFNTPWVDMMEVPLTSVSIKEDVIAETATQKLQAAINHPIDLPETIYVKPELIIRKSCGVKKSQRKNYSKEAEKKVSRRRQ